MNRITGKQFYFNGSLELSGNLIGLIGGANINKGKRSVSSIHLFRNL